MLGLDYSSDESDSDNDSSSRLTPTSPNKPVKRSPKYDAGDHTNTIAEPKFFNRDTSPTKRIKLSGVKNDNMTRVSLLESVKPISSACNICKVSLPTPIPPPQSSSIPESTSVNQKRRLYEHTQGQWPVSVSLKCSLPLDAPLRSLHSQLLSFQLPTMEVLSLDSLHFSLTRPFSVHAIEKDLFLQDILFIALYIRLFSIFISHHLRQTAQSSLKPSKYDGLTCIDGLIQYLTSTLSHNPFSPTSGPSNKNRPSPPSLSLSPFVSVIDAFINAHLSNIASDCPCIDGLCLSTAYTDTDSMDSISKTSISPAVITSCQPSVPISLDRKSVSNPPFNAHVDTQSSTVVQSPMQIHTTYQFIDKSNIYDHKSNSSLNNSMYTLFTSLQYKHAIFINENKTRYFSSLLLRPSSPSQQQSVNATSTSSSSPLQDPDPSYGLNYAQASPFSLLYAYSLAKMDTLRSRYNIPIYHNNPFPHLSLAATSNKDDFVSSCFSNIFSNNTNDNSISIGIESLQVTIGHYTHTFPLFK